MVGARLTLLLLSALPPTLWALQEPLLPRRTTTQPPAAVSRVPAAATMHTLMATAVDETMARLLEWEHARAEEFERRGEQKMYWNDPRIHNFGNTGWRGLLHALVVPTATHAIDRFAYAGVDARKKIHETYIPADADVVDLCCGVGFSPARNGRVTAVDTSEQMLTIARLRRPDVRHWVCANAETYGDAGSTDMATVMFGMHEMPRDARRRVMRNAMRIARDSVLVVDIWPGFQPTQMMLSGEPYVLDYLSNMQEDVEASVEPMQWEVERIDVVEEHVTMWRFTRLEWGI